MQLPTCISTTSHGATPAPWRAEANCAERSSSSRYVHIRSPSTIAGRSPYRAAMLGAHTAIVTSG